MKSAKTMAAEVLSLQGRLKFNNVVNLILVILSIFQSHKALNLCKLSLLKGN